MKKEDRLPYDRKAQEILEQLSLEEKVSLMCGNLLDFTKASRQEIGMLVMGLTQEATHYNVVPYGAGGLEKHGEGADPRDPEDRKSTRLNSSHPTTSRMPSSA